jgi:hypothetical protein
MLATFATVLRLRRDASQPDGDLRKVVPPRGAGRYRATRESQAQNEETVSSEEKQQQSVRLSTAHSRELGEELRRARRRVRMSATEVVDIMQWSVGKLSKLETGTRGTSLWDIASLLGLYQVDKAIRDRIMALAAELDTGSFLRRHGGAPDTLVTLSVHEPVARTITAYEALTIPTPAQTEEYALALTGCPEVVQACMERQRAVPRPGRRVTTLYLHEAALGLTVGTPSVMRDQLLHLTLMGGWADTHIRVVPQARGHHSALRHPATLLTFDDPFRPLVYVETDAATVFHEDAKVVDAYRRKMQDIDRLALDPVESRRTLARWAGVYEREAA